MPTARITLRGDGNYDSPEPTAWWDANDFDYISGLSGSRKLYADLAILREGDACATRRVLQGQVELRQPTYSHLERRKSVSLIVRAGPTRAFNGSRYHVPSAALAMTKDFPAIAYTSLVGYIGPD